MRSHRYIVSDNYWRKLLQVCSTFYSLVNKNSAWNLAIASDIQELRIQSTSLPSRRSASLHVVLNCPCFYRYRILPTCFKVHVHWAQNNPISCVVCNYLFIPYVCRFVMGKYIYHKFKSLDHFTKKGNSYYNIF